MRPTPTHYTCTRCRIVFAHAEIALWLGPNTPVCPSCGVDDLLDGARTPAELESASVLENTACRWLIAALRAAGIAVHEWTICMLDGDEGEGTRAGDDVLWVGPHGTRLVVQAPRRGWRVRVETTEVGVSLEGGFRCVSQADGDEPPALPAIWLANAVDIEHLVGVVAGLLESDAVEGLASAEVRVPESIPLHARLGDTARGPLRGLGVVEVSRWPSLKLVTDGGLLRVRVCEDHATFYFYHVLPSDSGFSSAKRSGEAVLSGFQNTLAAEWAAHGFREAGLVAPERVGAAWAVVIALSFEVDDEDALRERLIWALAANAL